MANGTLKNLGFLFVGLGALVFALAALIWVLRPIEAGPTRGEVSSYPIFRSERHIASGKIEGEGRSPSVMEKYIVKAFEEALRDPAAVDELQKELTKYVNSEEFREQLLKSLADREQWQVERKEHKVGIETRVFRTE